MQKKEKFYTYHLELLKSLICLKKTGDYKGYLDRVHRLEIGGLPTVKVMQRTFNRFFGKEKEKPGRKTLNKLCGYLEDNYSWNKFVEEYPSPYKTIEAFHLLSPAEQEEIKVSIDKLLSDYESYNDFKNKIVKKKVDFLEDILTEYTTVMKLVDLEQYDEAERFVDERYKSNENKKIGFYKGIIAEGHMRKGNLREALRLFEVAANSIKDFKQIELYAPIKLEIATINMLLDNTEKATEQYLEIDEITNGTNLYSTAAVAKINLGEIYYRMQEYEKAQCYYEEAQHLVTKYKVDCFKALETLGNKIKVMKSLTIPADNSLIDMVTRFFEGVNKDPRNLRPLLRFWYYTYENDLTKYFYALAGINVVIFSDDLRIVEEITNSLKWLFDYFLVLPNETFKGVYKDLILYPYDNFETDEAYFLLEDLDLQSEELKGLSLHDTYIQVLKNKLTMDNDTPRYFFRPVNTTEGKTENILVGWGEELPKIAYDFFENNTAESINGGNRFILQIPRFRAEDQFYSDILYSWHMGWIPMYIDRGLYSKDVLVIGNIILEIPLDSFFDKSKSHSLKKLFNSLLKIKKGKEKITLNDLKIETDYLFKDDKDKKRLTVLLVEFKQLTEKIIYPVLFTEWESKPSN